MTLLLVGQSSLQWFAFTANSRRAPFPYAKGSALRWEAPSRRSVEKVTRRCPFLTSPLSLGVPSPEYRRQLSGAVCHAEGSLRAPVLSWGVDGELAVAHPVHCLTFYARSAPFENLIELACALMGNYRFATSRTGSIVDAVPLTTPEELGLAMGAFDKARGAKIAQKAIEAAIPHLGSPYETILYLLLCLPQRMGGYGLPRPVANASLNLSRRERALASQASFYPDLFWPEARLVVEYDSAERHSSAQAAARDSRRRNELEALGYTVVVVTSPMIHDARQLDRAVARMRQTLGIRIRSERTATLDKRDKLRARLFSPDPISFFWR